MLDTFSEYFPSIQEIVGSVFNDISVFWESHLKPCFEAIGEFINNVLAPVFEEVFGHIIAPIVAAVFNTIGELWTGTLKPIFTNIIDFIKNVFSGNFKGAFQNIVNIHKFFIRIIYYCLLWR